MGNQPSNTLHLRTSRLSSNGGNGDNPKNRLLREHKRHGVVSVKINSSNSGRRLGEGQISHIVTPKGAILYGSLFNPTAVQRGIASSSLPVLVPGDIAIPDSRANKLLVSYCYGWHLIPFPEVFSRHSGTCYVVGDRNVNGPPVQIKVGDCFRLGSVGLVVSEMKIDEENEQKIDAKTLQFLKDEALAFDTNEDLAALASDEMMEGDGRERVGSDVGGGGLDGSLHQSFDADDQTNRGSIDGDGNASPTPFSPGNGLTNGERFICYMCYETHNTPEDPLIAPCECKGDTRFLHVHCLQKWYHTSAYGSHAQVVRTTGNGAPACKICGTAYKTNFKRSDGRRASILELENSGPYLSLVVVTHHDTNPGLFNTKFRLNFGRRNGISAAISDSDLNTVVIGRSSSCAMILDYRTVSTIHAKITYQNGKFFLSDNRSSNGTMIYIREPLPISYSQPVKIRMGRTTLSLQAKRSWTAAMRSFVFGTNPNDEANELALQSQIGLPSPSDVMNLLVQLHNLPPDKNSSNHETEGSHHPPTFLNHRSYTIRTINEGSVDGGEFDRLTDGGHGLAQHFHDFGNYGQDRFFVDGNEARQTPDNRRASESNSPMAMSPSPSHQQFNEENNQPNRIFLNNNSGSAHHQLFNSQASHSGREGGEPIITHSNEGSRQFRHIEFAEGDKTANNIYNNLQDITTDSHLPLSPNSTGGMRKTSLTAHEAVLMKEKTSILSKAASEAPFRDDEIEVEEDVVASNVSTMLSSPPRERGAGSTIVVGNHVEGNEIFQSINGSDNMSPGLVSQKSVANTEGVPAATIPVANVFALPSSAGSHRRGSSSVTPVNVISDDMEGVLRTVPSEEKSNN